MTARSKSSPHPDHLARLLAVSVVVLSLGAGSAGAWPAVGGRDARIELAEVLEAPDGRMSDSALGPRLLAQGKPGQPGSAPDSAPTVSVKATKGPDRAVIVLTWPEPPKVEHNIDGRDIVLRFDRELRTPDLLSVVDTTSDWLDSANQGYDSLLLRAALDVNYTVAVVGSEVRITMTKGAAAAEPLSDSQRLASEQRLRLLEIELKSRTDGAFAARPDAEQALAANPDSTEAMLVFADIETRLGNWQSASDLYRRFLDSAPGNPDALSAERDLRREHGPQYRVDGVRQVISGADTQYIYRQQGRVSPWSRGELGVDWEIRHIDSPSTIRLNGEDAPFVGVRQRAEIYGQHNFDAEALSLRGALLSGAGTVGAATRAEMRRDQSRTALGLEYHRAYWDYVEGFTNDGRRDRIALQHARVFGAEERVLGDLNLAMNRYGVRGDDDVATSFQPTVDLAYIVWKGLPTVTLNYNLDSEYRFGRETRIGPEGVPYTPLPIVSREVHSALVGLSGQPWEYLRFSTFAGYGYDRINTGDKGPRYGAELVLSPRSYLEFGLNFLYAQASSRGSGDILSRYGAYLLARF